jgi:hypothetical protein
LTLELQAEFFAKDVDASARFAREFAGAAAAVAAWGGTLVAAAGGAVGAGCEGAWQEPQPVLEHICVYTA